MLGIENWTVPLVCAPMAYVGRARLATAVSETGALGFIGFGGADSLEFIAEQMASVPDQVSVGTAFMAWSLAKDDRPFFTALEHKPAAVCLSFGDISPWVAPAKAAGATVFTQIGCVADLDAALAAGADAIVVRGMEAGGHGRNEVALLPLLAEFRSRTDVPLLAAGGIATRDGVKAVLAAGAVAAWVGTRFIVATESDSPAASRAALQAASADDTIYTNAYDRAKKLAWPPEFGGRALRTEFTDAWHHRQDELADLAEPMDVTPIYAGQGVGACGDSQPASEIVAQLTP